ncbi:DUF1990 domain-containing protein [Kitasatospora aureofaciens]|uniref:DUF1990 family protein n=1 Tax=Kitasatospora aureofaciens TaxID=1894 RepID=UPI001C46A3B0|nr:DUF1990 domain-containing protein [Kitasatospora aureofaciens]MBV6702644.1 DUF1990 domain-containing protein [Kitasatospora aureofaciens]
MNDLNYPEVGASATGELPDGYNHLRHRVRIGFGRAVLDVAGAALLGWRMHRLAGVRIDADADEAAPGVAVHCAIGVGPLRAGAPNRVLRSESGPDRYGFTYGTRDGHLACGEETFAVEMGPDKAVWFTVTAFSRPVAWWARLAGPLLPLAQRAFARRCGRVLAHIAADAG